MANGKVVWDNSICINCDNCIKVCQHKSTPKIELLSAREVADRCISNMPFIRGITTSGGECMLRPDFLYELFTYCNAAGLNCLIDSNGTIDFTEPYRFLVEHGYKGWILVEAEQDPKIAPPLEYAHIARDYVLGTLLGQ